MDALAFGSEFWSPQAVAALITAGASLLVSIVGFLTARSNQKHIEQLRSDLADRNAQRSARLAYEFEARKRLYQECGPLLFELSELAERALGRIVGLARTAADGNLGPGPSSWMGRKYYQRSTYYRLLAPLAIGKLLRSKLTHLDLSLDPEIHWQYALCKQLADTFTDDFDLANFDQKLHYNPHIEIAEKCRSHSPEVYRQQGIPRGILDNAVTALVSRTTENDIRVLTFAEFEARMDAADDIVARSFERVQYLLDGFHPRTRPVLWRLLVAQAHLYQALVRARDAAPTIDLWKTLWTPILPNFDWRFDTELSHIPSEAITQPIRIGAQYVETRMSSTLRRVALRGR